MTDFIDTIKRRQAASFGGLKVITRDEHVCHAQIRQAITGEMVIWSVAMGMWNYSTNGSIESRDKELKDPNELIIGLRKFFTEQEEQTTLVLSDIDYWLEEDPVLRRHIVETVKLLRTHGHLLILLSRHDKFNDEMADEISVIRHPLPDREATQTQLGSLLQKNEIDANEEVVGAAVDAVQGLTSSRQADAFSLGVVDFLIRKKTDPTVNGINTHVLRRYKEEEIAKLDFLEVFEPEKTFDDLIGHAYFKDWVARRKFAFLPEALAFGVPIPKGLLMVGPPGTGKTRLAEAVAKALGFPFLVLNIGSIFGSMLGESEANVRMAIEIAEKMSPCVLLVDEVERAFGGGGAGDKDGGTTDRVIGQFLTWLSMKTDPVFVMFTSNEADSLPAALIRKGRLDEIFFVDFSAPAERKQVFEYYLGKGTTNINAEMLAKLVKETDMWAPGEIEAAVGEARLMAFADGGRPLSEADIMEEITKTVPVSMSMKTQVERMRKWASEYARPTEYDDVKTYSGSAERKIGAV